MSSTLSPVRVVSFEEARHTVEQHAAKARRVAIESGEVESVDLVAARGRVLAAPLVADRDFPPFPRATRDGYAVRAEDVEQVPTRLEIIGEIKAGDAGETCAVNSGQAVSIMTGAPLPAGADAVVMVEHTAVLEVSHPNVAQNATLGWGTPVTLGSGTTVPSGSGTRATSGRDIPGKFVEIQRGVKSGENFVPRGAEARQGQMLVDRGSRLEHAAIAIAASVGASTLPVFRKPRVAVLSTGDEVVEIGVTPGPAQIRNSNTYSLAAQIEHAGGEAVRLPIAPDEPDRLRALIQEGLACDLLLLTGGVSMGKYDLVEHVLAELKAEFYFTGAKIQPGKPIVFGSCGADIPVRVRASNRTSGRAGMPAAHRKYFFGLPGNPVSTMVTFHLFAQPMVAALGGAQPAPLIFLGARLKSEIRTRTGLKRFLPGVLSGEFENAEVELAAWQGSGDIAAVARANCFLVIPPDRERIEAGEYVSVLPT